MTLFAYPAESLGGKSKAPLGLRIPVSHSPQPSDFACSSFDNIQRRLQGNGSILEINVLLNMNKIYEQGKSIQGICFEIPEIEEDGMPADR